MKVSENVYSLDSTAGTLAYVITAPQVVLIDSGRPGQGQKIIQELVSLNINPVDIRHILLTHHDIDHIGNAALLQQASQAEVWISQDDFPYIIGERKREGIKRVVSILMKARVPANLHPYPETQQIDELKIIATPGHTPGHICILYQDILFAGDLVMGNEKKLSPSYPIMTWNSDEVKRSIQKIDSLPFRYICPAHGSPMQRSPVWDEMLIRLD